MINFDLSWHRFSSGNTKAISADEAGYYSPEQKGSKNSLPPRSASTDVYMLGMILFFILAKEHPPEGGARLSDWDNIVSTQVNRKFQSKILRNRITRLILSMTEQDMSRRTDIEAVLAEIDNVFKFLENKFETVDHDFLVENILVAFGRDYDWDGEKFEGRIRSVPQARFFGEVSSERHEV